jgi:hypothetical protein
LAEAHDLDPFLKRRRLELFEQAAARQGYAYGVDVRRSRWLARSSLGNAAVRAVDRAWSHLSERMREELLEAPGSPVHPDILEDLRRLRTLLRAPRPALFLLKPSVVADRTWPPVTALGPARGGARWLVLDAAALEAMPPAHRRFWLASGLAHLQCGHGVFYTAHLLVELRKAPRSVALLRKALTPWSRVMAFSADRAGLLASEDLSQAIDALDSVTQREAEIAWLPRPPAADIRRVALEEFERSVVVARIRAARENESLAEISVFDLPKPKEEGDAESSPDAEAVEAEKAPPRPVSHVPEDAWSLARCDRRLTERLGLL